MLRGGKFENVLDSQNERLNKLEKHLNEQHVLVSTVNQLEKSMSQLSENVKLAIESNAKNLSEIKNIKSSVSNLQKKLDSESSRINSIQDQRYAGVSSLKAKFDIINCKVKDSDQVNERLEQMITSCTNSVSDIRKKVNGFENKLKSLQTAKAKSYSDAIKETQICAKTDLVHNDPSTKVIVRSDHAPQDNLLNLQNTQNHPAQLSPPQNRCNPSSDANSVSVSDVIKPIPVIVKTDMNMATNKTQTFYRQKHNR